MTREPSLADRIRKVAARGAVEALMSSIGQTLARDGYKGQHGASRVYKQLRNALLRDGYKLEG